MKVRTLYRPHDAVSSATIPNVADTCAIADGSSSCVAKGSSPGWTTVALSAGCSLRIRCCIVSAGGQASRQRRFKYSVRDVAPIGK